MSSGHGTQPQRVTLSSLARQKAAGEPVVMVTAYDFPSARIADEVGVDLVLVGDSAANVVLGYESTVPVTVEELLVLTRAVRRGLRHPLLVADLPFGSYEASDLDAVHTAQRFVKEGGAEAVKLERGGSIVDRARAIVRAGIPVVGHVGLTPQAATAMGGYRAQGRTAEQAAQLIRDALELEAAGCFAIVVEAVPAEVTALLAARLDCLTIGIGGRRGDRRAGPGLARPARDHRGAPRPVRPFLRRPSIGDGRGTHRVRRSRPGAGVPAARAHLPDRGDRTRRPAGQARCGRGSPLSPRGSREYRRRAAAQRAGLARSSPAMMSRAAARSGSLTAPKPNTMPRRVVGPDQ